MARSVRQDVQVRIVIAGKGGAGKTTLTALLAHHFSRKGLSVLAIDGDPQQNLAATLGIGTEKAGQVVPVSKCREYILEKTGARNDMSYGGLITINPDVGDVVDRFALPVADNLRLLVMGGIPRAGTGCLCPEYTLISAILRRASQLPENVILLDTPAGLEHFGRAIADGFSSAVIVAEPRYNALEVARSSAVLARQLGIGRVLLVMNKTTSPSDREKIFNVPGFSPDLYSGITLIRSDPEVASTEPSVVPLLSHKDGISDAANRLAGCLVS